MPISLSISDNLLPYGLIGAGAAWLLFGERLSPGSGIAQGPVRAPSRSPNEQRRLSLAPRGSKAATSASDSHTFSDTASSLAATASSALASSAGALRQVADQAGSTYQAVGARAADAVGNLGQIADKIRDGVSAGAGAAGSALQSGMSAAMARSRDYGSYVAESGNDLYETALDQVTYLADEHPLVLAALGVALGAAVGGLIPATESENTILGQHRDMLVHKAADAGHDLLDSAKRIAETTFKEARDTALHELAPEQKAEGDAGGSDQQ